MSDKNLKERLRFAKEHIHKPPNFWNMIFWSDKSNLNVFGSDGKQYVRCPFNKQLHSEYTKKTIKHGGASIMVWDCFTASGVDPLIKIEGIMKGETFRDILSNNLSGEHADNLFLAWIFQQDNDPKHSCKIVKSWLNQEGINVLQWPQQSPDLNPIKNLW